MSGFKVAKIDEIEAAYGGAFKLARATLDVSAFGFQVIDMPANVDGYPEHDHSEDGQEEVYVALRGSARMEVGGESHTLDQDTLISVKAGTKRKVFSGPDGLRMLVIGGVPGQVYQAPASTQLGAPAS